MTSQEFRTPCKSLEGYPEFQLLCDQFSIKIKLKDCPLGFVFDTHTKQCQCSSQITSHTMVHCDFITYNIVKAKQVWLLSQNTSGNYQIVIYENCPYDYCQVDNNSQSFKLEFPDDQCAFNRSGILCGACQENFSQVLGTSRCRKCSNIYLIAVIPSIILVGLLLIWFLMLLDLTVAVGTINGLIFYANIIRISRNVFFPPEISNSFLSVFIAWLNLDLGIEICFYNGLDSYAKTWLQLVFPFYIWLTVGGIIVARRYLVTISKITPNNQLQILATVSLLSYTKFLQVITTAFSYAVLQYSDELNKIVWLYDGNVEFLTGKHISLFIVCFLLLTLLIIPFTLSLLFTQGLQLMSKFRLTFWIQSLTPFFDIYSEPYRSKHRYWTGVHLLTRVIVVVTVAFNASNNPAVTLTAVAVTTILLLAYASYMGVYKNWLHNALEIALLSNLAILSVIMFYALLTNGNNIAQTTCASVVVTFIIFVVVVIYHILQKIISMRKFKDLKIRVIECVLRIRGNGCCEQSQNENLVSNQATNNEVTHTDIYLQDLVTAKVCDTNQQEA